MQLRGLADDITTAPSWDEILKGTVQRVIERRLAPAPVARPQMPAPMFFSPTGAAPRAPIAGRGFALDSRTLLYASSGVAIAALLGALALGRRRR